MPYTPRRPPNIANLDELAQWIESELLSLSMSLSETTALDLREVHVEPKRPRTGMIACADGTDWNPGSGAGAYRYNGSAWVFLDSTGFLLAANNLSDVANAATSFSNIKQAATTSASGVSELATDAESITGTDTGRTITPSNLKAVLAQAHFSAHKNASDQTGITDATYTKVTFGTELYDVGGYFASSTWTPPAGLVHLTAKMVATGTILASTMSWIAIYKNGVKVFENGAPAITNRCDVIVVASDRANGTDTYEVYCWIDVSAGTGTVNGVATNTYFMGEWLAQ